MLPLRIVSTRDLGPQFTENPHRMVGQDGAFSIPLGDETLFFFGDTLVGARVPGESLWYPGGTAVGHADMSGKHSIRRMINNTGLLLGESDGRSGLHAYRYLCHDRGELRCLIPLEGDEDPDWDRIWCLHGILIERRLVLFFVKVRMLETGPFPVNFDIVGSGMAIGDPVTFTFRRVIRNGTSILWNATQPRFAAALLHDPSTEWIYAFGALHDEKGGQECHLARVRPDAIGDPSAYMVLSSPAPRWSPTIADSIPVFTGMPNEMSVSFNSHLGCYLAVHSYLLSGDIVARTSPAPWGPWSDPVVLWSVRPVRPVPLPYPPLVYAGKEHPSLSADGGKTIYVTYIEFEEYFPHLVEVTLA